MITKKSQVIDMIAEKSGFTKRDAETAYNALVDGVLEALAEIDVEQSVTLPKLCKFTLKETNARVGRNPQNPEEEIQIPANQAIRVKTFPSITRSRRV